jgi:hypothetical protein
MVDDERAKQAVKDKINDYENSIQAIVGFVNFYVYDDVAKSNRPGVRVFQGLRLTPSPDKRTTPEGNAVDYVTPDLGVLLPANTGVLGEVKLSFPKDRERWIDDFRQLMRYDDDLHGWPSDDGRVSSHDIVLITHQSRAVAVRKFFEARLGTEISFARTFVIVQCNRSDQGRMYLFFQRVSGTLSDGRLDQRLEEGVPVPMDVFVVKYSTVKLYDAEPPLPYMLQLIWDNVVVSAARSLPKFETLRRKQKLPVVLEVDDIVDQLRSGFSFRSVQGVQHAAGPAVPAKAWVVRALEQLIALGEAEWVEPTEAAIQIFFQRYDAVLEHFIDACSCAGQRASDRQQRLF